MVDSLYRISITNEIDWEEYKEILDSIIGLANHEVNIIRKGGSSYWNANQLERVVIPEMIELLRYMLRGDLFLKYGKQQRLLESTYLLTDSVNMLSRTLIGIQIRRLQEKINSQMDCETGEDSLS